MDKETQKKLTKPFSKDEVKHHPKVNLVAMYHTI